MKEKEIKSICGTVFFMTLLRSILSNPLKENETNFESNFEGKLVEETSEEKMYEDIARRIKLYEPYIAEIGDAYRFPGEHNSDTNT